MTLLYNTLRRLGVCVSWLSKFKIARICLWPFKWPVVFVNKQIWSHKRRNEIKKCTFFGPQMLKDLDACLNELGCEYMLFGGMLLGAIREHSIMKHQHDIDVLINIEDYNASIVTALSQKGFQLVHYYQTDDGNNGMLQTYEYKETGVTLDIIYSYKNSEGKTYYCTYKGIGKLTPYYSMKEYGMVETLRVDAPISRTVVRTAVNNLLLPVPENYIELLTYLYGGDYMIPKPKFNKQSIPIYRVWEEKHSKYFQLKQL